MKFATLSQATLRVRDNATGQEVIVESVPSNSLKTAYFSSVSHVVRAMEDGDNIAFFLELNGSYVELGTITSNVVSKFDRKEDDTRARVINPDGTMNVEFMGEVVKTSDIGFTQAASLIEHIVQTNAKNAKF